MKSSKRGKKADTKKIGVNISNTHLATLHERLYHGLNLGFRYHAGKEKEWQSNDVEIHRLVIRSMSAFLDAIVPDKWQMPIVKDSIPDMFRAIGGILQSPNEAVLPMGLEVAIKLISIVPMSMLQPHLNYLSHSFSPLLSNHQTQVAIMSATALHLIVSKLSITKEKKMWEVLEKYDVLGQLIDNLKAFSDKVKPIDYFQEMASLLSSIMHLWPSTRYPVWSDVKLMEVVEFISSRPEANVKVAVLRLYSTLALCANGAQKLMENGKVLIRTIVQCLGNSEPYSVRILAFKVAQNLMATEQLCSEVLKFSRESIIKSIICALTDSGVGHREGELLNQDMSLMVEACRLALISRWQGKHHDYLWRFGVDKVLVHLLMNNRQSHYLLQHSMPIEELIAIAREGLCGKNLLELRPYVWEIIGLLSAQCEEGFAPTKHENEHSISLLVASACLAFVDSIGRERMLCQADRIYSFRSVSAAKATLMMLFSPCPYIASQARLILSEVLRIEGEEHLKHLLHALNFVFSGDNARMPDRFQLLTGLLSLAVYSGLPQFYRKVVKYGGVKTLLAFLRWWLDNASHFDKVCISCYLRVTAMDRYCCRNDVEDWEGKEILLLMALWSLAALMNSYVSEGLELDIFVTETTYSKDQFVQDIQKISLCTTSSGVKWHCSYVLSFFGFYGFPNKLGTRIASICEKEHGDMHLVHRNGPSISVHRVILRIRCPSLLLLGGLSNEEKMYRSNSFSTKEVTNKCGRTTKEVTLSAKVDHQALSKLLDFVYSGYLQADEGILRNLRVLAKYCNIQALVRLLCRKRPKWGTHMPSIDFTAALGPDGHAYSDIILEAKSTENAGWTCSCCSLPSPHIHAHRAILSASCEYMRALFQSGMQDSLSQSLKVPVSWEALHKLVIWTYSNHMPKTISGCLWASMDIQQKLSELQPYIELCWLAEYWFLDDVKEECSTVVNISVDSPELAVKVMQFAATYSQWELVEIATNKIAPAYRRLHSSGALDVLDEALVETIRLAAIRLRQE
ncbi:unnamed protein product [Amaranthus hypochondriacus]